MRDSYLDYAMSVIVSRALPDVRDGLKPVQRRMLFGMQELGVGPNSAFKKTARIVGEVMGKFHPHGDAPIYDTLVRLAQPFTLRYPLVTGQGNFGSVDGDPPAQMRYTEARLAPIATEMLADLDRDTVDFQPNFDDSVNEPVVLPSRLPNLLLNGSTGIAVGMATSVPPHNLNEICDAVITLIDNPAAGVEDLMRHVRGPDFPTRGRIFGQEAIREAYATGRGKVTMRGVIHTEETASGRLQIIIDELPYQVNKTTLITRIADLVRARRIEGVSDLRDESDRDGMRVVIELSRTGSAATVENQLFRLTAMQSTFAVNMLALVDGQPRTVSLKEALEAFIDHRREVIRRRSEFDLARARDRAHVLEGLLRALEFLDEVIAIIRNSESADAARRALMDWDFGEEAEAVMPNAGDGDAPRGLSERQAQAVLDMQLRRLAALERQRIADEHAELMEQIAYLEDLLANPEKIDALIQDDCRELKADYGDERRTQVFAPPVDEISDEDLVPHQQVVVTISDRGYMKRVPLETYRLQGRGGRGVTGAPTREEDAVNHLVVCDTHDSLLLFTRRGRVYSLKGYETPEGKRQARGIPVINLVEIEDGDRVTAMVVVTEFSRDSMVLATARGDVKRTPLDQFESVRRAGLIAMNLKDGDVLVTARAAGEDDTAILVSSGGRAIRFRVGELRVASRMSGGVRGMRHPRRRRGNRVGHRRRRRGSARRLAARRRQAHRDGGVPDEGPRRAGRGHVPRDRAQRPAGGGARGARAPRGHPDLPRGHRDAHERRGDQPSEPRHAGRRRHEHRGRRRPRRHRPDRPRRPPPPPPPGDAPEPDDPEPGGEQEPEAPSAPEPAAAPEAPAAASSPPARRAADIDAVPAEEMRAAIEAAVPSDEWVGHDDAVRAVSRRLGFARLSASVRTPIERAIHLAVLDRAVEENSESRELRRPSA